MAKTHRLEYVQVIPLERSTVFSFFSDAFNLERLTPSFLNFSILTPAPIHVETGTLIEYTIRLFGIPMKWRTEIERFEPEREFVDNQIRGPYRLWHHTHTFEDVPGGTLASTPWPPEPGMKRSSSPGGRPLTMKLVASETAALPKTAAASTTTAVLLVGAGLVRGGVSTTSTEGRAAPDARRAAARRRDGALRAPPGGVRARDEGIKAIIFNLDLSPRSSGSRRGTASLTMLRR